MVTRLFQTYFDAREVVEDEETLRQAILTRGLIVFVELHEMNVRVYPTGGAFPEDGKNTFSEWEEDFFANEGSTAKTKNYCLSGWFRLNDSSARRIARGLKETYCGVIAEPDGGKPISFQLDSPNVDLYKLWFRTADIEGLVSTSEQTGTPTPNAKIGKSLDARERTTLLCIIGALASHAELDVSQPIKAGDAIAAMMPDVKLSGRTIGEHLKAVREAMDSRKG